MGPELPRRGNLFYPLVFAAWAIFLLVQYRDHRYEDTPPPSAGFEREAEERARAVDLMQQRLLGLQEALPGSATESAKAGLLRDIGRVYTDLFNATADTQYRDSAAAYLDRAGAVQSMQKPAAGDR
jgi:hypothetical protein